MRAFIVFECTVPDNDISESLDFHVGAIDILREQLSKNKNPCAYGMQLKVLTENEWYNLERK